MVDSAISFSRSGLREWVWQRISAIMIASYFIFLLIYLGGHSGLTYGEWQALFSHPLMRIYTVLALLSVLIHAWIGMLVVFTDYVKCAWGRLILQTAVIILSFSYVVWGVMITWGWH